MGGSYNSAIQNAVVPLSGVLTPSAVLVTGFKVLMFV
jgi:hypothetical protein